jgi:hypothetical protein
MLRHGCYVLRLTPQTLGQFVHYDGTLRVERHNFRDVTASGDLYAHRYTFPFRREPEPTHTKIPIFKRANYRYYMRVTRMLEGITFGNSFALGYSLYRYNQTTKTWSLDGKYTAQMTWKTAPSGYPSGTDYLTGDIKNSSGTVIGTLTMAHVSNYLRRAMIEVDRVRQSEYPEESGYNDSNDDDIDWRYVFKKIGWKLTVVESDVNLPEASGESWSTAEMHKHMLKWRDTADLDSEWRYHLLCIRRIDVTSRGIMYDNGGTDSNNVPREGAAIASHWTIPNTNQWGKVKGKRFGLAEAPYFRTAVHEVGHAMGLYHNAVDNGFMNTTGVIAASGTTSNPFPDNVLWRFNADDEKRLKHMPDAWVRPGMVPFGASYSTAPMSVDEEAAELPEATLDVRVPNGFVPIGAPVRVDLKLSNISEQNALAAPTDLSLKAGHVEGTVTDPSGTVRSFRTILQCIDDEEIADLAPGASISDSLTLIRGKEGALFPLPGVYDITVKAEWAIDGVPVSITGSTQTTVTPAMDEAHAKAALQLLSTPDLLPAIVFGGDHITDGVAALQTALKDPVLKPHYAIIEAKRLGRLDKDVNTIDKLVDNKTVLSEAELQSYEKVVTSCRSAKQNKDMLNKTKTLLKKRVAELLKQKAPAR